MATFVLAKATTTGVLRQSWANLPKVTGCFIVQHRDASSSNVAALKRGTGGRSSFSGIVATVFGATGFLGRYVVNRLGKIGSQVIIPYRGDTYELEPLRLCGDLGQILFFPYHLKDEEAIRKTVQYSNVVINLVGREFETKNFDYNSVHVEGARRLARISRECGVEKFIHISHLNAKKNPQKIWSGSEYLKSKYESELAVREEFPDATIFKPADIHGDEDRFLNYLCTQSRSNIFRTRLGLWKKGEQTIKQPVFVGDVAGGIVAAIKNPDMAGKNIDCVGPHRYYLADMVDYMIRVLRRDENLKRVELSPLVRLKAMLVDKFPTHSWFNNDKLEREGITDWPNAENLSLEDLGVSLTPFDERAYFQLFPLRSHAYYAERLGEFDEPAPLLPAEHYSGKSTAVPST